MSIEARGHSRKKEAAMPFIEEFPEWIFLGIVLLAVVAAIAIFVGGRIRRKRKIAEGRDTKASSILPKDESP